MAWFESVAEAQRRARRDAAALGLQGDPRRGGARADLPGQPRRVRGARVRAARRGRVGGARRRRPSVMGVSSRPARAALARRACRPCTRRASVAVARAAAARGTAMGLSALATHADRGDRRRRARRRSPSCTGRARARRSRRGSTRARAAGARGLDPHARLDVQPRAGLGHRRRSRQRWTSRRWRSFAPEVLLRPVLARALGALRGPAGARRCRTSRARRGSSPPTASGWARRRRPGRTSRGCGRCGTGRSWSRA